jgi:biotin carboxylase
MYDITEDLLHHIGYDNNSFNIEFFWNKAKDKIWLLEVNTRVSQSHSDLFENVDGASNHQITVELGLGNDPHFPKRKGDYKCAAKFFYRYWEDGYVKKAPSEADIEKVQNDIPGVLIVPQAEEAMRLSDMLEKDSYSYELCWIFVGGKDHKDLVRKYREAIKMLPYEIERVED